MTSRASRWVAIISVFVAFTALVSAAVVFAGAYGPCSVPPVVSQATRPNVMIVMDYSGSMQFPAYFAENYTSYYSSKVADCYNTSTTWAYIPANQYYGTFDSDTYYKYDATEGHDYFYPADPQPVSYYTGTADSQDGGGGTIQFTADGHTFKVGDLVALYDLSSHKGLNGDAHQVVAVGDNTFKVTATWNGKPDRKGYRAIKRITGDTSIGISGNILSFAATSRIDAALKALIGGKATTVSGDTDNVYLQAQGSRRYVGETTTNVNCDFYVRPATLDSPAQAYPDNYSDGNYTDKDIFVTIFGRYQGTMDANDPVILGEYTEPWTFTLTRTTRVQIKLEGSWPNANGSRVAIYSGTDFTAAKTADSVSTSSNTTTLSVDLSAGTYYVRVAPYLQLATVPATYTVRSSVELTKYTGLHTNPASHNGVALTKIGAMPWARVRIKIPKEERKGLVDDAFPYVRFGFMFYNSAEKANKGKILVGCDNTDIDRLRNAMEGRDNDSSDGLDFTQAFPYYGTPTGPALQEVYDYFNQHSNSDHADNSKFVSSSTKATLTDPFYSPDASGNPQPVPCRKSFALLLSDGVWNEGTDPVNPAVSIHTTDLRPESQEAAFTGDQVVDIYAILAFSQDPQGTNSMKAVAMYGSFKNVDACGTTNFPYPKSGTPSDSKNFTWPVSECNPASTYNTTCCAEWDSVWDRDEDGTEEQKGIPDAYYQANNGKELEAALKAVFTDIVSRHASASAVATVSQELSSGDIIIRGVFDAADPDKVDSYLWRGHLEAYLPFMADLDGTGEKETYDFEVPCNTDLLCMDIPGGDPPCPSLGRHCWDSGYILSNSMTSVDRTIFTGTYDTATSKWENRDFVAGTTSPDITKTDLEVATDADAANLVAWVRGDSVTGLRDRDGWLLADIVYSTPVVVGPPRLGDVSTRDANGDQFLAYRNDNIHREKVIYVGANDGMLHAFLMGKYDDANDKWIYDPSEDSEIGRELWAYLPSNMLTEVKELAKTSYGQGGCAHRSTVDLAPRSWEVYIKSDDCTNPDSQGRCWRTVLVGGERGGGDVYFAIDVSNPRSPKLLWEYSVLKSRVVVEYVAATNPAQCVHDCRDQCDDDCEAARLQCRADCDATYTTWPERRACRRECDRIKREDCVPPCEDQCNVDCANIQSGYKAFVPFREAYESIKILPLSWSQPYLGRIKVPTTVQFYVGDPSPIDPVNGGEPSQLLQFDGDNNLRAVVFMGGGLHIFDKEFDTTPSVDSRFKLAAFWPFLLMMDIETGYNLFEYVWPIVVNQASANFPLETSGSNVIPYAMSDPLALDVWNQELDIVGDDGLIDRVYVGDLNGYFYAIKFNLDPLVASGTNSDLGILVQIWPTKQIDPADADDLNDYRSQHREPITVSPAATFEKGTEYLRVIFGTGKFDNISTGNDDKTDPAKMALYNVRDKVELPDLGTSDAYEVYDANRKTNFKVRIVRNPDCLATSGNDIAFFSRSLRPCTWATLATEAGAETTVCTDPTDLSTCSMVSSLASSSDCCEKLDGDCVDPCFECIYDFMLPTTVDVPGERVIGKPLIAGGVIFVTTYVPPSDPCGYTGQAYLYVFGVDCVPLTEPGSIVPTGGGTAVGPTNGGGGTAPAGVRVGLGSGVPSKPVLDSRGENVIIQMSDGTLKRIGVNLPQKPLRVRGWRAR